MKKWIKVRHAQGVHNVQLEAKEVTPLSENLFDAQLSTKGLQQVSELRKQILESGLLNTIELVITSPLHSSGHLLPSFTTGGSSARRPDPDPPDSGLSLSDYPPLSPLLLIQQSKSKSTVEPKFTVAPPKATSPLYTNHASTVGHAILPLPTPPSKSTEASISGTTSTGNTSSHPHNPPSLPAKEHITQPTPNLAERLRFSADRTLKRQGPQVLGETGIPRVVIPEKVFQRGADQHKDFIICFFCGRAPPYKQIQNVLNHMWGKGRKLETHRNPLSNSMLPSTQSDASPALASFPIWAHLRGVPLDLRTLEGLGWVAGMIGEPKETDDFTMNLVNLVMSHVKVEADLSKPLPRTLELVRSTGQVVKVEVDYPWIPATCSHCKEVGHIAKNCLQLPPSGPLPKPATHEARVRATVRASEASKGSSIPIPTTNTMNTDAGSPPSSNTLSRDLSSLVLEDSTASQTLDSVVVVSESMVKVHDIDGSVSAVTDYTVSATDGSAIPVSEDLANIQTSIAYETVTVLNQKDTMQAAYTVGALDEVAVAATINQHVAHGTDVNESNIFSPESCNVDSDTLKPLVLKDKVHDPPPEILRRHGSLLPSGFCCWPPCDYYSRWHSLSS
ncbi:unnamed protein product [Thlaspi arvense]|uniref:CCHC-type domain-containing protein n=1 Tax=Thlaspi arvense TaxID=13288 RepID=A0AAU9R6Q2_THLAR|nr:unnamed protein product [Thlaspi arvense]